MHSRYDECVRASEEILHLPDLTWGGAYPLLFSFVEWKSNKHAQYISELEQVDVQCNLFV